MSTDDDQLMRDARVRQPDSGRWLRRGLIALAIAVIGGWFVVRSHREPTFEGKPLSKFLIHLSPPIAYKPEYQQATNALFSLGPKALPTLLDIIRHPEPWYVRQYFQRRTNMPKWMERTIRKRFDPWSYRTRLQGAIQAVGILGTNAAPIAPELVAELPRLENSTRTPLSTALVSVGPAVVEPIKPLLTSTNMRTRSLAAYVCYMLNVRAADAAPELVAGLMDGDANHRRLVAQTLSRMGPGVRPIILDLLRSTNTVKIAAGLEALEWNQLSTSALVETMLDHLTNPDPEIRRTAALRIAQSWPVDPDSTEKRLAPKAGQNGRVADYLLGIRNIVAQQDLLIRILKEGATSADDAATKFRFAQELIRHQIIDADVVDALDKLANQTEVPQLAAKAAELRDHFSELLTVQTNSRPRMEPASQSAP